jgi:hypothetical protein
MSTAPSHAAQSPEVPEQTGWVGWVVFGAFMMMIVGAFSMLEGLGAIFKDEVLLVTNKDLIVSLDYTAWGWVHLILGAVVVAAGVGLLTGQTWARILGAIAVSINMLVNFAFVPAYPFWSLTVIALGAFVLFAILAHGREMR